MAYPQLSRAGLTTVVVPRGPSYPSRAAPTPRQSVSYSEAGQARTVTFSDPEQFIPLAWERLPTAIADTLVAWFEDPLINWSAGSFIYTDVQSVAATVRLVLGSFVAEPVAAGLSKVSFTLRVEPF
jgi:hypothetical protein